jgi:DNA-binding response OmpR family regulator
MAKILLVDDDAAQRLICQKELEEEHEIIPATDGLEAIECLKKEKVDLVVLDVNMPRMDGMEVLGKILSLWPGMPVILYSGFDSYRDSFMSLAADAYIKKSCDISELKLKIKHLLKL